jgi:RNase H-like domain found in reverse transcriptase/Integrase core domain/Integrase zinc binding domain
MHLKKSKCQFFESNVKYLGHRIDANGLHPLNDKVVAIRDAATPNDVEGVRTFLGLVNYYHKFIPGLATKASPLNRLLGKGVEFSWSGECKKAFELIKKELTSDKVLTHYDPKLPLIVETDASPVGLGAVLTHKMPDGTERPIAFASRTLSSSERNYSQIDKEATAIAWGIKKFFQYCYGRNFTLRTDHKPLVTIFNPDKALPALSASRMLNYALFLSGFKYTIEYRSTHENGNADYLSRFPLPEKVPEDDTSVFQAKQVECMPVTREEIQRETPKDAALRQIYNDLQSGSPNETQSKFSLHDGCLFYGIRVVIPKSLRPAVLAELHEAHLGMTKMKALARSYCFWNGIDADIEATVKKCRSCCLVQNEAAKVPVHSWEYPSFPFQRIHIDYAGPFMGTNFLVIVDAYSKWPEIIPTKSTDSAATIRILRNVFARFGIPVTMVSDNGPQFRSDWMARFTKRNGIRHKFTAPYHPASNGQAERYVQILKKGLRCMSDEPGDLYTKLDRLLIQYRKAPNITTNQSPSELMFGRQIRTRLDLLKRQLAVEKNEEAGQHEATREFEVGEKVQVRSYRDPRVKWVFGTVFARLGLTQYEIAVEGVHRKCHVNQILPTFCGQGDRSSLNHTRDQQDPSHTPRNERHNPQPITLTVQPASRNNTQPIADPASPERASSYFSTNSATTNTTMTTVHSPVAQSTPLWRSASWRQSGDSEWTPQRQHAQSDESTEVTPPTIVNTPRRSVRDRRPPNRLDL